MAKEEFQVRSRLFNYVLPYTEWMASFQSVSVVTALSRDNCPTHCKAPPIPLSRLNPKIPFHIFPFPMRGLQFAAYPHLLANEYWLEIAVRDFFDETAAPLQFGVVVSDGSAHAFEHDSQT